jgi:predicted metalloprotease
MRWQGRKASNNVRDARSTVTSARGGGSGAAQLIGLAIRLFGIKGIAVLAVVGVIGWQLGLLDPQALLGGSQTTQVDYQPSPEEEERFQFVSVVLADTERVWTEEFARLGARYEPPTLVIFRDRFATGCGIGDARAGPFYCPADRNVYIDLGFYDELARAFQAPGDFAQAYVIAHEVGHHVQNLLGIAEQVNARRGQPDFNEYSVRLELQADYLAGVWTRQNREYLDRGDIEEAMRAAQQVGDDVIQQRTQGRVVPHAFTHGTAEQRMRWFENGLESGQIEGGDTFAIPYDRL